MTYIDSLLVRAVSLSRQSKPGDASGGVLIVKLLPLKDRNPVGCRYQIKSKDSNNMLKSTSRFGHPRHDCDPAESCSLFMPLDCVLDPLLFARVCSLEVLFSDPVSFETSPPVCLLRSPEPQKLRTAPHHPRNFFLVRLLEVINPPSFNLW